MGGNSNNDQFKSAKLRKSVYGMLVRSRKGASKTRGWRPKPFQVWFRAFFCISDWLWLILDNGNHSEINHHTRINSHNATTTGRLWQCEARWTLGSCGRVGRPFSLLIAFPVFPAHSAMAPWQYAPNWVVPAEVSLPSGRVITFVKFVKVIQKSEHDPVNKTNTIRSRTTALQNSEVKRASNISSTISIFHPVPLSSLVDRWSGSSEVSDVLAENPPKNIQVNGASNRKVSSSATHCNGRKVPPAAST